MNKRRTNRLNLKNSMVIGSLLFGMVFGAGNTIFPISVGQNAGSSFFPASLGFLVTAVGFPVLAVISFSLSEKESLFDYTAPAGKGISYFFSLALLMTIGPMFATPRTATVSFEVAFKPFYGENSTIPLLIYTFVFFALVLFFALKPTKILDTIGRFMAPIFIVLISILIIANLLNPMGNPADYKPIGKYAENAVTQGMIDGYSTMDVLACLAFAIVIIDNLKRMGISGTKDFARETAKSSITTLVIMSVLYIAFVHLGASSLGTMELQKNGGLVLAFSSTHFFKSAGHILLAATIGLACLKTAIGLAVAIPAAINRKFPNFLSLNTLTVLFVLLSFLIANFGLDAIISLSIPFLYFLYPLSFAYIILWITNTIIPLRASAFKLTIGVACIPAVLDFMSATPDFIKNTGFVQAILNFGKESLPLFKLNLFWVIPVGIAFLLSVLFLRDRKAVSAV